VVVLRLSVLGLRKPTILSGLRNREVEQCRAVDAAGGLAAFATGGLSARRTQKLAPMGCPANQQLLRGCLWSATAVRVLGEAGLGDMIRHSRDSVSAGGHAMLPHGILAPRSLSWVGARGNGGRLSNHVGTRASALW